jgi:hypothetical protein
MATHKEETHMSQPSFEDILSMPIADIKPPKPLPAGEYLALIESHEVTEKGKNKNHCVIFSIRPTQALNQDPTFQQDLIDALEGKNLRDRKLSHTLWLTPDAAYRLRIFLIDHLGLEDVSNLKHALSMVSGKELIVTIGHYVSTREGEAPQVGMEIKATAKA